MASFASSYIPTTTAQVTRAADVAVISGANFSNFYNQTEGTWVVDASVGYSGSTFPVTLSVHDGSGSNAHYLGGKSSTTTNRYEIAVGGVNQATLNSTVAVASGVAAKTARAYKVNDYALTTSGEAPQTDVVATVPTVNQMHLGSYRGGSDFMNGNIRSITYYPTRLTNAQLVTLST